MRRATALTVALALAALPCAAQDAVPQTDLPQTDLPQTGAPQADGAPPPAPPLADLPLPPAARGGVLVIRQDDLFDRSAFGQAARQRIETASRALATENREIEAALEAEERTLTDRRRLLAPADFRALADEFNTRVEGIRAAQEAKTREIGRMRDLERQRFLSAAVPVLAELMRDTGASVLLDQGSVVLSLDAVDVTDTAIRRIDAAIGAGAPLADPPPQPPPQQSPPAP